LFIVILVCYKTVQDKLPYYNKDRGECDNPTSFDRKYGGYGRNRTDSIGDDPCIKNVD